MAPFGPCTARARGFCFQTPGAPRNNDATGMAGSPGAAPRAPGARWPNVRQSRPQVRPACRRYRAGSCLSWGCICACQWRQAAVLRAADSSGGRRRREKGLLLLHITTSRRSRSASSPASPGSATGPGAFVGLDELLSFCSGTTGPAPRGAVGLRGPRFPRARHEGLVVTSHRLQIARPTFAGSKRCGRSSARYEMR